MILWWRGSHVAWLATGTTSLVLWQRSPWILTDYLLHPIIKGKELLDFFFRWNYISLVKHGYVPKFPNVHILNMNAGTRSYACLVCRIERFLLPFIFIRSNIYSRLVSKYIDWLYAYCTRLPNLRSTTHLNIIIIGDIF